MLDLLGAQSSHRTARPKQCPQHGDNYFLLKYVCSGGRSLSQGMGTNKLNKQFIHTQPGYFSAFRIGKLMITIMFMRIRFIFETMCNFGILTGTAEQELSSLRSAGSIFTRPAKMSQLRTQTQRKHLIISNHLLGPEPLCSLC